MTVINVTPVQVRRARKAGMITPEELGERYLAVHHRMFRAVNDEMSGCGLSLARSKVLLHLKEHGPTRQSVLAIHFGMAPHSITDIVDGLERQGLAQRRPDATDRRAKLVAITDAGEACLGVACTTRDRLLTQIFGALGEADRATLLRVLGSLDEAAQHVIDASPDLAASHDLNASPGLTASAAAEPAPA